MHMYNVYADSHWKRAHGSKSSCGTIDKGPSCYVPIASNKVLLTTLLRTCISLTLTWNIWLFITFQNILNMLHVWHTDEKADIWVLILDVG